MGLLSPSYLFLQMQIQILKMQIQIQEQHSENSKFQMGCMDGYWYLQHLVYFADYVSFYPFCMFIEAETKRKVLCVNSKILRNNTHACIDL